MIRQALRSGWRITSLTRAARAISIGARNSSLQSRSVLPSTPAIQLPFTRNFASQNERTVELLTFPEVKKLSSMTKEEYVHSYGKAEYFTMLRRLKSTWQDFCVHNPYPTVADLKTYFNAGSAMGMDTVMVETLLAMREIFPKELKSKHYLDSRVSFLRLGKYQEMISIFESEKIQHPHPQPVFYIWAITAYIELNNLQKIKEVLAEMKNEGYMVPNETVSRLLYKLAQQGDKSSILDILPDLDPNVGIWTVPALNRVLTSLGIVGLPQEAFKFYGHSTMELDASTFKTVLEIAVRNRCTKEATDILQNRQLFDLKLDTPEFNIIIEALILLERPGEIPLILEEMAESNVRPNAKTEHLIKTLSIERTFSRKGFAKSDDDVLLQKKLDQQQYDAAASIADGILLHTPTPKMILPIIQAYIATNQHEKIDEIIKSMQTRDWPSPPLHGLMFLIKHYCKRERGSDGKFRINDPARAFQVYKAAKHQRISIWQPKPLFPVMLQLCEWKAAVELFDKMLKLEENVPKGTTYKASEITRTEAFNDVMRVCAKSQQYDVMVEIVDKMLSRGYPIFPSVFKSLWFDPIKYSFYGRQVSEKRAVELDASFASALATILNKIYEKQPSFSPTNETIDSLANILFYGKQRRALVELYRRAKHNKSNFILPELTYHKIAQALAHENGNNIAEIRELLDEAFAKLDKVEHPGVLQAALVRAVAQGGQFDEMHELLAKYPSGATFRWALEALLPSNEFEQAELVLQKMLDAGYVPNVTVLRKAMDRFAASAKSNPSRPLPIHAFFNAFEQQVLKDDELVKRSAEDRQLTTFSSSDIHQIYTKGIKAFRAANDTDTVKVLEDRLKKLNLTRVNSRSN